MRLIAALALLVVRALGAEALPGCEPRAEVRQAIELKLTGRAFHELKYAERIEFRRRVLEDLIGQYPREVEPHRLLIQTTKNEDTAHFQALVERYKKEAEVHPDDPLALYLAGAALTNIDTDRSIQLEERARKLAPDFPWPALELADIYRHGTKRADKKKSADEIAAFFAACPSSADYDAQHRLSNTADAALQARVAIAMRARLANETDPARLKEYATLWGLEFRARAPTEHETLRKQVAADLQRLETINPHPDAAWLAFLKNGYKQSGASAETVTAMEDRVIQTFPHSNEAYQIVSDRWDKLHKEPEDQTDTKAWDKYHAEHRQALKQWMPQFTDSRQLQHQEWFWEFRFDPNVPEEEGMRVFEDYLAEMRAYDPPGIGTSLAAAGYLAYHKWHPERIFDLLRDWNKLMDEWDTRMMGDNQAKDAEEVWSSNDVINRQSAVGEILTAARMTNRPEETASVKAFVEREFPAKSWPHIQLWYWWDRARLAAVEGRNADALTYYQRALQARKIPWPPVEGHVIDDLTDESRALWKEMGGTEAAWNLWSKPPALTVEEAAATGWKKPDKDMPFFELPDLSGKTWRLRELGGRVLFINVWATWCGPCQEELPQVEKLYQKVKDRKDVQLLTLTIDDDLGAVAPFMKEKGYTFPVLPAKTFVSGLLDVVGIPQNWIVDGKGVWRWTGGPGGPMTEWSDKVLQQMEAAR